MRCALVSFVLSCASMAPLAIADQAASASPGDRGTEVKRISNVSDGNGGTKGGPISTQDLRVQVNCPANSGSEQADPVDPAKDELTPEEQKLVTMGAVAKLTMLSAVLLAALWMFFLAGRLLKPSRIADAANNFYLRQHWGGFGGESSGWRMSASLGACVSGLVLVILATSLVTGTLFILHKYEAASDKSATTTMSANVTAPVQPAGAPAAAPAAAPTAANDGPQRLQ